MSMLNYDAAGRYTANKSLDQFILGSDAKSYSHAFITDDDVPCCDLDKKVIYSPVMPTLVDEKADRMVRAKNEHEAGHGRFTPQNMQPEWSKTMRSLVNVLEDLRIERGVGMLAKVFADDLAFLNKVLISEINAKMAAGVMHPKAVDEAIMALHFEGNNEHPQWVLSPVAKLLHDSVKGIFDQWIDADFTSKRGYTKVVEIATEIVKVWEQIVNSLPQSENGEDMGESGDGEGEDKQSEQKSDKGKGKGKQSKSEKSEKSEGADGKGEGEKSEQKSDKSEGEGDGEGEQGEKSEGADGKQGKQGEGKKSEQKSEQKSDKSESKGEGEGEQGEKSESESESEGNEKSDKGSNANQEGHEPEVKGGSDKTVDCRGKSNLDEMIDGTDAMTEQMREMFKEFKAEAAEAFGGYTSYTADDEIVRAEKRPTTFELMRKAISGKISALAAHLEQTLRTKMRCRIAHKRERGGLDMKNIANIAKSMTRYIFAEQTKGMSVKNTAVTILIDESGSIGATCYEFQKIAIAFSEVFDRLGIKFEILGHTTGNSYRSSEMEKSVRASFTRYTPVVLYEHKNFDESYKSEKYRLGSIDSWNCNIDGDVLATAFRRINAQRAERRIIFVLSDGCPNASQRTPNEVFDKHLKKMVEFCRKNGTEVYAFGIGTTTPKKFYGEENFVYIKSTMEIGGEFFRTLSKILIEGGMK